MSNITFLMEKFASIPNKDAFYYNGVPVTYGQLRLAVKRRVDSLRSAGVSSGDCVLLLGDYSPLAVESFLALTEIGCILVPLTPNVYASLDAQILADVAPKWKLDTMDTEAELTELKYRSARPDLFRVLDRMGAPGLVLFTSGSSGKPKAVVHNFAKLLIKFHTPRPAMITINFLLFDHWGGLNTLLHCLSNSCLVIFPEDRSPQSICGLIEKHKVELLPTTPSFLNLLLISGVHKEFDLSSLKLVSYGSEPMPITTLKLLNSSFPNIDLRQTYGMIELGVLRAKTRSPDSLWIKMGGEGYKLRVRGGVLEIKAESAMLGYINAESPFTDDGYLITGDLVEQDGEWLRILGRQSDIINVGGQKVYPAEVEAVILDHPDVRDATVYGASHALTGKIVCADIVLLDNSDEREARKSILIFCNSRLQKYMVPMKLRFVTKALQGHRLKRVRSQK